MQTNKFWKHPSQRLAASMAASMAVAMMLTLNISANALDGVPKRQSFVTKDQVRLVADIYNPATTTGKHPAVILVHQLGNTNVTMTSLVRPLQRLGFIVINLDMRGHGLSTSKGAQKIVFKDFSNKDWAMLPSDLHDVSSALASLSDYDGKLAVIGASIGANAALIDANADAKVKAVVAISPGLNFHDVTPESSMPGLSRKPALILAAKDDSYSADSAAKLSKMDPGSSLEILESGGHGYQILVTHPDLNTDIATWLHKAMP